MSSVRSSTGSVQPGVLPPTAKLRSISLNDDAANEGHRRAQHAADNSVTTSKYNVLTFLPLNLLEFFRVVANVYFLVISALQVGTTLSPTNSYTTIGPLSIVLAITMIKQGIEDWKRHMADRRMNARKTIVVRNGQEFITAWRDVKAGDILLVKDREELPADIVLLASSEEEARSFTETANLDGETNLKRRVALKPTAEAVGLRMPGQPRPSLQSQLANVSKLRGELSYEMPNNSLYTFVGTMTLADGTVVPVRPDHVILRGCVLRSCKHVFGLAIFTGHDTKLMQNSRATPFKQSKVYRTVNKCIFLIFLCQFLLCLISSINFGEWIKSHSSPDALWYMGSWLKSIGFWDLFGSFFTFLILYNNLVPISLYVSLDMIKVAQAKFIERDPAMCYTDKATGEQKWAKARTSDLNEDLGQIEYIFSDKTGTLTQNLMEFRKCSIGGISYGFGTTEIGMAALARQPGGGANADGGDGSSGGGGSSSELGDQSPAQSIGDPRAAQVNYDPSVHFDDPRLLEHLRNRSSAQSQRIEEFLILLAVCHTVIPERDAATNKVTYRASSPDEEALVKAAKALGFDFKSPAPRVVVDITAYGEPIQKTYEVLNINEFNSNRKRMSVVVREGNRYILYCKGADSVMYERSTRTAERRELTQQLYKFASEGLRTLVLAKRQLHAAEYEAWNKAYQEAAASMVNRDELLEQAAEKVEVNMTILGATAIEDKLQVGVPGCIADLSAAGIKIWVLTGDKEETAINIGYACRLLNNNMVLIKINQPSKEKLIEQLRELHRKPQLRSYIASQHTSDRLALIVDGKSLQQILHVRGAKMSAAEAEERKILSQLLLQIARCCTAVVACRVSPAQKAAIVKLVRKNIKPQPVTLAIGDGANDVNMIQTAHVGIGISGQEGVQAVNSSDYAIAQFRFLKPLLLVHGRLNYQRVSRVILYSFYKNIALVIALFLFNFYNAFTGTTLFESFVMAGWNFFLAMPIIIIGIFDYDVPAEVAMNNPSLYPSGQWNLDLNVSKFGQWILNAVIHAVVSFYFCFAAYKFGVWDGGSGMSDGLYVFGTAVYSCLLMTMNYKVALTTRVWTLWFHFFFWGSILLFFLFLIFDNSVDFLEASFHYAAFMMWRRPAFWLLFALTPMAAIMWDLVYTHYVRAVKPTPAMVLAERVRFGMDLDAYKVSMPNATQSVQTTNPIAQEGGPVEASLTSEPHTGYDFTSAVKQSQFASSGSTPRLRMPAPPSMRANAAGNWQPNPLAGVEEAKLVGSP